MFFNKEELVEKKAPDPATRYAKIIFDNKTLTNAPLSMAAFRFEPGQIGPKHVHAIEVEVYYCLKGRGMVIVDDEEFVLEEGCTLYIAPGKYHETKNIGTEDFEFLGIFGPCLNLDFIRDWN